jgi:hypothetical protein
MCNQPPIPHESADLWAIRRSCAELEAAVRSLASNPHADHGYVAAAIDEAATLAEAIARMLRARADDLRHPCPTCGGSGRFDDVICGTCGGDGRAP